MNTLADATMFQGPFHEFSIPRPYSEVDIPEMSEVAAMRIADIAVQTPVFQSQTLSSDHAPVYVKDESKQLGRCFKPRGAFSAIAANHDNGSTNFETASGGSFAIGAAIAAKHYGCFVEAVVPETTPMQRQATIRIYGANLQVHGEDFQAAQQHAQNRADRYERTYLHPFADVWAIAGQATIGSELAEQVADMTHLVLPVGGGSLLTGVASVIRKHRPNVQIIAAQVAQCTAFVDSLKTGKVQEARELDTRFSGLAVSKTHPLTLGLGSRLIDQVVVVSAPFVYETLDLYREHEGVLLEESGAVGPAAARYLASLATSKDAKIVTVATGANPSQHLQAYAAAVARRRAYERQTH
jgi:threonine dehydratase